MIQVMWVFQWKTFLRLCGFRGVVPGTKDGKVKPLKFRGFQFGFFRVEIYW